VISPDDKPSSVSSSSSTPGEIVIGSMPPSLRRRRRAGEVEAKTSLVTGSDYRKRCGTLV